MNTSRGSIGILLLIIIGLVVVGGGAYYFGTNSVIPPVPQETIATTSAPEVGGTPAPSTTQGVVPIAKSAPTTCEGHDPMKPVIFSLTPTSGPAGTKVTIKGCNLAGFEADLNATFVRSDGEVIPLYAGTLYRQTPSVAEEQSMTVTLATYCPTGSITGLYSGAPQKCDTVEATPGAYSVYTVTPSGKSNTVTFTVK